MSSLGDSIGNESRRFSCTCTTSIKVCTCNVHNSISEAVCRIAGCRARVAEAQITSPHCITLQSPEHRCGRRLRHQGGYGLTASDPACQDFYGADTFFSPEVIAPPSTRSGSGSGPCMSVRYPSDPRRRREKMRTPSMSRWPGKSCYHAVLALSRPFQSRRNFS
jgi:hypothetical protein